MSEASPERELPQHWRTDGAPKHKYETFTEAIVAAHIKSDGAGWLAAYPCYCANYHIGRPRPDVEYEIDDATIHIHLRALGWRNFTAHHYRTGEPMDRWERPQGDTHLPAGEAWAQITRAVQREAQKVIGSTPVTIPGLVGLTDDEARETKFRTLIRAGWKPPRCDGDPWQSTRVTKQKTGHYTLDQAWAGLVARQSSLPRNRKTIPARVGV